jgi:hypothetical protein
MSEHYILYNYRRENFKLHIIWCTHCRNFCLKINVRLKRVPCLYNSMVARINWCRSVKITLYVDTASFNLLRTLRRHITLPLWAAGANGAAVGLTVGTCWNLSTMAWKLACPSVFVAGGWQGPFSSSLSIHPLFTPVQQETSAPLHQWSTSRFHARHLDSNPSSTGFAMKLPSKQRLLLWVCTMINYSDRTLQVLQLLDRLTVIRVLTLSRGMSVWPSVCSNFKIATANPTLDSSINYWAIALFLCSETYGMSCACSTSLVFP